MFCLLALTNAAASNTTYIIEPIMIGTNHFEQDPGKRHAPPRQVILSVEQEENVFITTSVPLKRDDWQISY